MMPSHMMPQNGMRMNPGMPQPPHDLRQYIAQRLQQHQRMVLPGWQSVTPANVRYTNVMAL